MPKWRVLLLSVLLLVACSAPPEDVVTSKDFTISRQAFEEYKANVQRVSTSNQQQFDMTDEELVQQMIERQTLLTVAKKRGIHPTDDEVLAYAKQSQQAFEAQATAQMKAMHQEAAEKLGVTKAAYFTHPSVLKQYNEVLTLDALISQLTAEGVITKEQTLAHYVQTQLPEVTINIRK